MAAARFPAEKAYLCALRLFQMSINVGWPGVYKRDFSGPGVEDLS